MHFTADSDTGHMASLHERLEGLHASMKARGASESALARLPKLPTKARPLAAGLPPIVLATRANGTHWKQQEASRVALAKAQRVGGRFVDAEARAIDRAKGRRDHVTAEDIERVTTIRQVVATVYRARITIARVRRHAVAIAREVTGLSYPRLTPLFGMQDPQHLWRERKAFTKNSATDPTLQEWDRQIREALPASYFERAEA